MFIHISSSYLALLISVLGWTVPLRHLGDRLLWHPSQAGVQLQMFPTCQQVADGVKLWTVTHQLVDSLHLCQDTEEPQKHSFTLHVFWLMLCSRGWVSVTAGVAGGEGSYLWWLRKASPQVMAVSPVSMRNVEVFPAPFTPSRPKHWRTETQSTMLQIHIFIQELEAAAGMFPLILCEFIWSKTG